MGKTKSGQLLRSRRHATLLFLPCPSPEPALPISNPSEPQQSDRLLQAPSPQALLRVLHNFRPSHSRLQNLSYCHSVLFLFISIQFSITFPTVKVPKLSLLPTSQNHPLCTFTGFLPLPSLPLRKRKEGRKRGCGDGEGKRKKKRKENFPISFNVTFSMCSLLGCPHRPRWVQQRSLLQWSIILQHPSATHFHST